jgi:hypothetical protein
MNNRRLTDSSSAETKQSRDANRHAQRAEVRSASWLKIVVFALPVIIVAVGVIWASSLE